MSRFSHNFEAQIIQNKKAGSHIVIRDLRLHSTTIYLWLISLTASKELSILLLKLYNDGAIGISSSNLGLRVRKID